MSRRWQIALGTVVVLALIAGPVVFAYRYQAQTRNFRVVRDGVLYRSGQMRLAGLKRIIHEYGIKTVITLRDAYVPGQPPPDRAEEEYCNSEEINYVRIPPAHWEAPDGSVPAAEGVRKFLAVMDDPRNYPVLVHCCAGIHRTGAYCSIFRMEFDRWSNARAIAEMKACGYSNLEDEWDILNYLEQYRPRWRPADPEPPAGTSARSARSPSEP